MILGVNKMLTYLILCTAGRPEGPTPLHCEGDCVHSALRRAALEHPASSAWTPLPLGKIAIKGWLLEQALIQANSLSGFMPTSTFPGATDVNTSIWVGGGAHEGGTDQWLPYWANGNVPLLMLLRAAGKEAMARLDPGARFEQVVESMVEYVLEHTNHTTGWIGPFLNEPGDANGHGLWDPLNMLRALLMYAEGEPKQAKRVATAVVAHLTAEYGMLKQDPVYKWASTRWPTFVQVELAQKRSCTDACSPAVPAVAEWPRMMPTRRRLNFAGVPLRDRLSRSPVRWGRRCDASWCRRNSRSAHERLRPLPGGHHNTLPIDRPWPRKHTALDRVAFRAQAKGMDWDAYYSRTGPIKFPLGPVSGWNTNDHGGSPPPPLCLLAPPFLPFLLPSCPPASLPIPLPPPTSRPPSLSSTLIPHPFHPSRQ